jgi:antagonist of KipI
MTLEVIEVNGLASIQDAGRTGLKRFGVTSSGPMDRFAFCAANALAENDRDDAVVEIGLGDIAFRAMRDCVIAVAGVGYALSVYIWDFPLWGSFYVRSGWVVRLHKTDGGMWAYLTAAGGVQVQPTLGSRSTYLHGTLGGFKGRSLQVGDRIEFGRRTVQFENLAARTLPVHARPAYGNDITVDVIMGPQKNYFSAESIETFLSGEYSVSLTSDRMGYRLDGPALSLRDKRELISEGMTPGSVQVPSNGQPIVMMADCPTTGGYPKVGAIASADLPLLAQCVPGAGRIHFRETTVAKAQKKYRGLMNVAGRIVGQHED